MLLMTLGTQAQVLIIPDVHGRTFWKEAVSKYPDIPIVFLGDYLDPYGSEGITPNEALENFREILKFKKENKERVTLLIGNHEIHYFDQFYNFSRKDTINKQIIHDLLYENLSLFKIAAFHTFNKTEYLFSHAGVLQLWWEKHFPNIMPDAVTICNTLNKQIKDAESFNTFIDEAMLDVGVKRGGEDEAGSCVWADVSEHSKSPAFPPGVYQIFGHTQLRKNPVIKKRVADLDCRRAFILTAKGIKAVE